jgi:hypothetical protein
MRQIPLDQWGRDTARVFQGPQAAPRDPRAFVQDSGEAMGRALSQSGQGLQDTAAQLAVMQQREQERQRIEAEQEAARQARERQIAESIQAKRDQLELTEKVQNETRQIAARTDLNAEEKRKAFDAAFSGAASRYQGRYVDPQVSGGFSVDSDRLRLTARDELERGILSETQSKNEANILASLDTIGRMSPGDPDKATQEMDTLVRTSGAAAGWDAAKIETVVQNQRAAYHYSAAAAAIDSNPAQGLADIRAGKYKYLDPDRQLQLTNTAEAELERQAARAERQSMARLTIADRAVGELASIYDAGGVPKPEMVAQTQALAAGTPAEASLTALMGTVADRARFANLPLDQQAAEVQRLDAAAQDPAVGVDRAELSALNWKAKAYNATVKAVKDDPLGAAAQRGLVELDPLDLTSPEALGAGIQDRMRRAAEVEAWAGRPVPPLTRAEIDAMAAQLKAGTPQAQEFYLKALSSAMDDPQAYIATLRAMAPKNPALAQAGRLLVSQDAQTQRAGELLLEGERYLNVPADESKKIQMPVSGDLIDKFESMTEGAYGPNAMVRDHDFQNWQRIYAALSVQEGAYTQKDDGVDTDRAKRALAMATGGIDEYNDANVVLPRGLDVDQFGRRVRSQLRAMAAGGMISGGLTPAQLDRLPVQIATRNGRPGYRVMQGGSYLLDPSGAPVFLDLESP